MTSIRNRGARSVSAGIIVAEQGRSSLHCSSFQRPLLETQPPRHNTRTSLVEFKNASVLSDDARNAALDSQGSLQWQPAGIDLVGTDAGGSEDQVEPLIGEGVRIGQSWLSFALLMTSVRLLWEKPLAGSEKLFASTVPEPGTPAWFGMPYCRIPSRWWLKYNMGLSEFWICDWKAWPSAEAKSQ